jgi:hypothetical protein
MLSEQRIKDHIRLTSLKSLPSGLSGILISFNQKWKYGIPRPK